MAQNNENTEQSCQAVTLCSGGCGFFGNPQFDGMCSKCYKDALKRKQATNPPQEPAGRSSPMSAAAAISYLNSIETASPTVMLPKSDSSSSATPSSSTSTDTSTAKLASVNSTTPAASSASAGAVEVPRSTSTPDKASTDDRPATPSTPDTKTKKRNRCGTCKKKVGLTGFECRCGGLYCSMHRYSDKHDCQFDYKKEGEDLIRKNNPVVIGAKLQKI